MSQSDHGSVSGPWNASTLEGSTSAFHSTTSPPLPPLQTALPPTHEGEGAVSFLNMHIEGEGEESFLNMHTDSDTDSTPGSANSAGGREDVNDNFLDMESDT